MEQQTFFDDFERAEQADPCRKKSGDNPESAAAWERVAPTIRETHAEIVRLVREAGANGLTSKEIAAALGKPLHAVSGRCSELKRSGKLRELLDQGGETVTREGSAVLVLWDGATVE